MTDRTPGLKLALVAFIALLMTVPLFMVYGLVRDREGQSQRAQAALTSGWGGPQVVSGPVLVIPYTLPTDQAATEDNPPRARPVASRRELFLSPVSHTASARLSPERRGYSIYTSVLYQAKLSGSARFVLPPDLDRLGIARDRLLLDQAELRFGVLDARGLLADARISVDGRARGLEPGKGPRSTGGAGFHATIDWSGAPLAVTYSYGLRGSHALALVPSGGETRWNIASSWPHPSFAGGFLPADKAVSGAGFEASYSIPNLALGQSLATLSDRAPPALDMMGDANYPPAASDRSASGEPSQAALIRLIEPVDLYSRVDRSVKYGFLFIGFTFLTFLLFDIVGGARVASAEYAMSGVGLVLFFVLLLAFAEVIGFVPAYLVASIAIVALLTAYSAAILRSRRRASFIGVMLAVLYSLMFTLLSLEAFSLVIGSVLLFLALAGVMYATRNVDWSRTAPFDEPPVGR